jgi:hypothetical protein
MIKIINKNFLLLGMFIFLIQACAPFLRYDVFEHIDSCKAEYEKYHPNAHNKNFRSKTCSRVTDRKCVINKYCKDDLECIAEAKRVYPPYGFIEDEAYCLNLVKKAKKSNSQNKNP